MWKCGRTVWFWSKQLSTNKLVWLLALLISWLTGGWLVSGWWVGWFVAWSVGCLVAWFVTGWWVGWWVGQEDTRDWQGLNPWLTTWMCCWGYNHGCKPYKVAITPRKHDLWLLTKWGCPSKYPLWFIERSLSQCKPWDPFNAYELVPINRSQLTDVCGGSEGTTMHYLCINICI